MDKRKCWYRNCNKRVIFIIECLLDNNSKTRIKMFCALHHTTYCVHIINKNLKHIKGNAKKLTQEIITKKIIES